MIKTLMATASVVALLTTMPASAQTTGSGTTTPPAAQMPATTPPAQAAQQPGDIDVTKLIGRNVVNAQNETVSEIESVIVGSDGKVKQLILGVGGFLGIGERHVAVAWDQITVTDNGNRVTLNMSRDQLRALPEFRYAANQRRGTVWTDIDGRPMGTAAVPPAPGTVTSVAPAAGAPGTTAALTPLTGDVSTSRLIGLNLRNAANETVGEIKDVILGQDGKVTQVIVGVGGFLGMGERYVSMSWDQLKMQRADDRYVGTVGFTRDQLRDMPAYRLDRSNWVRG